ncbi:MULTISPECIES: maleylacetate reductase and hydroxyquinol 1,2-dioxygenase domain-containing protein [Pseudonocardia]|uniref:Maleylacetate reductase n=2 Tax=Pseudonocardia TaxID=1847 RepID=A0A1Y2MSZ0_PSEAH|nr:MULTISPECIES: maleylacetate reductase and hydroxyquinol 1,2-dioxygenase domain-containing protein [Pseudonocardia]OSY38332.1 Maleylacetate reductase [Pseudonocardia autotrophica]TDN72623.1 alcohol dehydrogenase class IV [Pseudonocardia autotrophica]BBG03332.1 alcohol dehydrogenase [Pseudonocardia autotrophica]GEC24590.1 alcohol dehydrogenase [Pseudonocardia saturnea]
MTTGFVHTTAPSRIVFGAGTLETVPQEVTRLGRERVLVLASPELAEAGDRIEKALGPLAVARFDGAAMHTPVPVTDEAAELLRAVSADCVVAVGGGSTTGLAKALAARTGIDQVVVPTTYAGSEVTPVLGETADGVKTTRSSPDILPETVVYDVELSAGLPVPVAVTSAVNALAHAVEALYSPDANPAIDALALDAIRRLATGLRRLGDGTDDLATRSELLQGAWLAGTCLGAVGMSLHHKLCHTLGGSFDLPHAPTHTVVLPHAMAYNAAAAPAAMARVAEALGVADAPSGVYDLVVRAGGPTALGDLGLAESDIAVAAGIAVEKPYPNPAELTRDGIEGLLRDAWAGQRPRSSPAAAAGRITEQAVASFAGTPDPRLHRLLTELVPRLHDFAVATGLTQDEWAAGIDFLTRTGHVTTATRQEFILLSDTLGLSSVVDLLTHSRTPDSTPSAVLGPFYVEGPPELAAGADIAAGLPGTPLFVDVAVTGTDGTPIPDAVVDVWQSDDNGFYDVQLPDVDGPVLRARFRTDPGGALRFRSILPREYPVPDDGPVGEMLAATGRHPYRAPHLHFMIDAPGYARLITQLFVRGGRYLDSDAVFGVKDDLVVDFAEHTGPAPDGHDVDGPWRSLGFTFVLQTPPGAADGG